MKLGKYIEGIAPINTIEKVDKLLLFIKTSGLEFDESADYEIRMAIKKLSLQRYYSDNRPDYDYRPPSRKGTTTSIPHFGKKKRLQLALLKDKLYHNGKGMKDFREKEFINDTLNVRKTKRSNKEEKRKRKERRYEAIDHESVNGNKSVPDFALRRLAKNNRDYSYTHPTIKAARKTAASRTKEQLEQLDWDNRPHIIYTPMGGQNKK